MLTFVLINILMPQVKLHSI